MSLTYDNICNAVGIVEVELSLDLLLNSLLEVLTLNAGNGHFLEYCEVRRDADDSFLVGHLVSLEHTVDKCCNVGHVSNVTVNDESLFEIECSSGADLDLSACLRAFNYTYISIGYIK